MASPDYTQNQQRPMATTTETIYQVREKPSRPLSAYNLFFQEERVNLLKDRPVRPEGVPRRRGHGKMGFREMATTIGKLWKAIDPERKAIFEERAKEEKIQYKKKLAEWKKLVNKSNKSKGKAKKRGSKTLSVGSATSSSALDENSGRSQQSSTSLPNDNLEAPTPGHEASAAGVLPSMGPTNAYAVQPPATVTSFIPVNGTTTMASQQQMAPIPPFVYANNQVATDPATFQLQQQQQQLLQQQVAGPKFSQGPPPEPFWNDSESLGSLIRRGATSQQMQAATVLPSQIPVHQKHLLVRDMDVLAGQLDNESMDYFVNLFHR